MATRTTPESCKFFHRSKCVPLGLERTIRAGTGAHRCRFLCACPVSCSETSLPVVRLVRMTDAQEAARTLARARWGTRVLSRAVQTVVDRSDDLDELQRESLRAAADQAR